MSDLIERAEECLSKPCELHSEHEKALYALRDCVAEIQRLSAVGEPVCSCPSGDGSLRWPCKVHPPETAPPSVDALIAELDALLNPNSEWVGNMDNVYINYYALKAVRDKYRSAK